METQEPSKRLYALERDHNEFQAVWRDTLCSLTKRTPMGTCESSPSATVDSWLNNLYGAANLLTHQRDTALDHNILFELMQLIFIK